MEIELYELIRSLKAEISKLQQDQGPKMLRAETVVLEIKFLVDKTVSADGGAHFLVFAAKSGGSYKSENVHSVKIKFVPAGVWSSGIAAVSPDPTDPFASGPIGA